MVSVNNLLPQLDLSQLGANGLPAQSEGNDVDFGTLLAQVQDASEPAEKPVAGAPDEPPKESDDETDETQKAALQGFLQPQLEELPLLELLPDITAPELTEELAVDEVQPDIAVDTAPVEPLPEQSAIEIPAELLETLVVDEGTDERLDGLAIAPFETAEEPEQAVEQPVAQIQQAEDAPQQNAQSGLETRTVEQPRFEETANLQEAASTVAQPERTFFASEPKAETLDVHSPQFAELVADKVAEETEAGKLEFDIALYPKQLGKVTVNVQIDNGMATISFICENARAQSILNRHADDIGGLVQQNTGKTTEVDVPQTEHDPSQQDFDGHQNNGQQSGRSRQGTPQQDQVEFFIDQLKASILVG